MLQRATFSYSDEGMVASTDSVWLHGAFDTLTRLFDKVGLQTNSGNTVGILRRPYSVVRTQLEEACE